jgi:hypothetical protein
VNVRTAATSEDLRNYSRNGYTSTFTGELRPIPENIQLQLKKNLPEYKFHIARMSVLIDPPQTKYDLILVTSANTGDVKSYLWGHYWMIPPAGSFVRLLEGHNSKSREDAIDTVKSSGKLIAYTATAQVGKVKNVTLLVKKSKEGDNAASLVKQLGIDPTSKAGQKLVAKIEKQLGSGDSIQLSKTGGIVGQVYSAAEHGLTAQAKYSESHPNADPRSGPNDVTYNDCSMTCARTSLPNKMQGVFGGRQLRYYTNG